VGIVDGYEIDIADPVFEIPRKGASEDEHFINEYLPMALSSALVPMKPSVSIVEFSKVLTLVKAKAEFLHGVHDHFSTSAFLQ
jgi:hypothetical protein